MYKALIDEFIIHTKSWMHAEHDNKTVRYLSDVLGTNTTHHFRRPAMYCWRCCNSELVKPSVFYLNTLKIEQHIIDNFLDETSISQPTPCGNTLTVKWGHIGCKE